MIVFQLICANGHRFETWFRNSAAYEAQSSAADITCPSCGDNQIGKAPMAPHVAKPSAKSRALEERERALAVGMRKVANELKRHVEETCDYVAKDFPEEARRIHYGEVEERGIYGEASNEEATALRDEGIDVQRIPWGSRRDD